MAFQFVHASSYSIKSGGAGIAAEAGRKPSHSKHVDDPKPPVLVAGMEPEEAWAEVERRHENARDPVTLKSGKTAQRRMRKDALVLLAAVASYPSRTEDTDTDSPEFQEWMQRSIEWLTEQHGEPLSVVLHLDESHPHIHFLTAPDLEAGERMSAIHPGERAKERVGGRDAKKSEKDQAYKHAMRGYQNSYHRQVGVYHGLGRFGPKRQRLSRPQWKAQQAELQQQAERLRELERQREQVAQQAQQNQAEIDRQQAEVDAARAELEAANENLETAKTKLGEQREKLQKNREYLVGKAQEIREARSGVRTAKAELKKQTNDLDARLNEVEAEERRLGSLWGKVVSAVTFGRAGTEKRVRDAVEAERERLTTELDKQAEQAEQAESRLTATQSRYRGEKAKLVHEAAELERRAEAAESAQNAAETKGQELAGKVEQLEADNRHLAGDREELRDLLDSIEDAARAGDMDTVQHLLAGDGDPHGLKLG